MKNKWSIFVVLVVVFAAGVWADGINGIWQHLASDGALEGRGGQLAASVFLRR
jgi:hypothetical protein